MKGVYLYQNVQDNYKSYVGQAHNLLSRHEGHCKATKLADEIEAARDIDAAIKKYGINSFNYQVLWSSELATDAELDYWEAFYIKQYDSKNNGYNLTRGNHAERIDRAYKEAHVVGKEISASINDKFKLSNVVNCEVVIIGQWYLAQYFIINNNNVHVIHTSPIFSGEAVQGSSNIYVQEKEICKELSKLKNKKDLVIISNPPYGKIGADITKFIVENLDFKQFINLLPANDYKRADNNLWQFIDMSTLEMVPFWKYGDASVTTHVCSISHKQNYSLSKECFEIEVYGDPQLRKFFYKNLEKKHYAIDNVPGTGFTIKNAGVWDVNKTFIFHNRDMNHKHMGGSDSMTYKWNIEKSISMKDILERTNGESSKQLTFCNINFNTKKERDNFTKFIYNNEKFIYKLFSALNIDMGIKSIALPKVDWSKSWTVEEILKEYDYTKTEINSIMECLNES